MIPAAICTLALIDTQLSTDSQGFVERTTLQVEAPCPSVTIPLPPAATVLEARGKGRLWDDTKRKLDALRWRTSPPGADGHRDLTVFLGDLLEGDRAELTISRRWTSDRFLFDPAGAEAARLRVPNDVRTSVPAERGLIEGDVGVVEVVREGAPAGGFEVVHPSGPPSGDVVHDQRLTLIVPEGDPQRLLYPGAGSSVKVEDFYTFAPSPLARSIALPLSADVDVEMGAEPDRAASLRRGPDGVLVEVRPWEGPVRVALVHTRPDAPTYGERPDDVTEYTVSVPGGEIAWAGDAWHLVRVGKRPILPDAASLMKALDHRFRHVALPEPGLPQELRGRKRTWDLAADLRPTLFEAVRPGLPADPLWPRKLVKARKGGLVSDTEAMLILWLYGRQAGLRTDWALVRPAHLGPIDLAVPSGFSGALVRIDGGDEVRFIDAGCLVCAPFEVRPWLEGGTVLSPAGLDTPPPQPGVSELVVGDEEVSWHVEGPPALLLRLWLEPVPASERGRALAERIGGPGARLLASEGIAEAGAPIDVRVLRGKGLALDPLALPPADDDGAWADWVGVRTRRFEAGDVHGASWSDEGTRYTRTVHEGVVTEVLELDQRAVPRETARVLSALRAGVRPPPRSERSEAP